MAERQIIWSNQAESELYEILQFYIDRNKSNRYSEKILKSVEQLVMLLSKNPYMGKLSNNGVTRVIVKSDFLIFYEVHLSTIEIISFWDNRQDPGKRPDNR
jgi:plasmid stabilization system protein ParE